MQNGQPLTNHNRFFAKAQSWQSPDLWWVRLHSLGLGRLLSGFLFGVKPGDPGVYAAVILNTQGPFRGKSWDETKSSAASPYIMGFSLKIAHSHGSQAVRRIANFALSQPFLSNV